MPTAASRRPARSAKLNDVDPQAWLADVLARIANTAQSRLHELLPWEWRMALTPAAA
jgi:transposase